MYFAFFIPPLLLGLFLVWLGLRGRTIDNHPICRNCGFDLFGSGHSAVCSECGRDLNDPKAINLGHRKRRRWPLTLGLLLAVPALTVLVALSVVGARGVNLNGYKPLWLLVREGDAAAVGELQRRQGAGTLSSAQVQQVVAHALDAQADRCRVWQPGWGDFVEAARTLGNVTDAQWQRYARAALMLELTSSPTWQRGESLPMQVDHNVRVGAGTSITFDVQFQRALIDTVSLPGLDSLWDVRTQPRIYRRTSRFTRGADAPVMLPVDPALIRSLKDGRYPLEAQVKVIMFDPAGKLLDPVTLRLQTIIELVTPATQAMP
jgi:hypothetical protein